MRITALLILTFISLSIADPLIDLTGKWSFTVGFDGNVIIGYSQKFFYPVLPVDPIVNLTDCDPALLKAIMEVESDFDLHALSKTGAMGVAQFVTSTADWIGLSNPFDPIASTFKLCDYLKYLSEKFGTREKILWAYHDGEGNVRRFGPSRVGRLYASKVLERYEYYSEYDEGEFFRDSIRLSFSVSIPSMEMEFGVSGSLIGIVDYRADLIYSDSMAYRFSIYLRVSDELAPFLVYDGSFKWGVSYRLRWFTLEFEPFSPNFTLHFWNLSFGFDRRPRIEYAF